MQVPDLYWADAASIGPVQARYWHLPACLQGYFCLDYVNDSLRLYEDLFLDKVPVRPALHAEATVDIALSFSLYQVKALVRVSHPDSDSELICLALLHNMLHTLHKVKVGLSTMQRMNLVAILVFRSRSNISLLNIYYFIANESHQ